MGIFDALKGSAGKAVTAAMGSLGTGATSAEESAVSKLLGGAGANLPAILEKLKSAGLGDMVTSWIGGGENKPLSADQVKAAFGPDEIGAVAKELGVTPEMAIGKIAQILPALIDKLTPDGLVPDPEAIASKLTGLFTK